MKLITISQSTHAKLATLAINGQIDVSNSTLLPDDKIGISVDDEVFEALTKRLDKITPTYDDVINTFFIKKQ